MLSDLIKQIILVTHKIILKIFCCNKNFFKEKNNNNNNNKG